jgi:hypothetical protein
MFDAAVCDLDAAGALAAAEQARAVAAAAEVRILQIAAHWADLHGVLDGGPGPVLPGEERLVDLGGAGTPAVGEFCPAELGAVLASSTFAASRLIADALDLRHRLPRLWARTVAGEVKPWIARKAAEATRSLTPPLAAGVDAAVAPYADRLSWGRLEALIEATGKRLDPAHAAVVEDGARHDLGVWVNPSSEHGTRSVFLRLEAPAAIRLDAAVQRAADALGALGDQRDVDTRRAAAVGVLADPQAALDLYAAHAHLADPDSAPPAARPRSMVGSRPDATLYVHVSDETLRTGSGVARVEGVGPVTAQRVREWLTNATVTVRPVLDLNQLSPVDGYEVPPRLAEAVRLRSPVDCFPYATSTRRGLDLDHTEAYLHPDEGGPPGQTRQDNLAPLTRAHHRVKTHGRWQVRQVWDGVFAWRSPHGAHYLVDHTGTTRALVA